MQKEKKLQKKQLQHHPLLLKDQEYNKDGTKTGNKHPHIKPKETETTVTDHYGNQTYKR